MILKIHKRPSSMPHAARLLLGDTPFALQVDLLAHASVIAVAHKQNMDWEPYHVKGCSIASVSQPNIRNMPGVVRSRHSIVSQPVILRVPRKHS